MDYAIIASPQLGRDHWRGSNHGRTRGQVGGHLFLPPQTATNGAPNTDCCSCPRLRPSIVAWTTATVCWLDCQHTCSSDSSLSWMRRLGSSSSYLAARVCQFRWQRSCTGSDSHIESRTSCASWSTKVCMDWHPTTWPYDVFKFVTFLAILRSALAGQLMVPITNKKDDCRQRVLTLWPCGME